MVVRAADGAAARRRSRRDPLRITEPTVIVTAQKEPADIQRLPVSVTAVPRRR